MTMTAKLDIESRTKTAKKASIVSFITILIFAFSGQLLFKFFGETGNNVLMRLMGLIVMVIAVEFFFSGLKPIILEMQK